MESRGGRMFDAPEGYDIAAEHYDGWKWQRIWARTERPLVCSILKTFRAGLLHAPTILDVGVGTGALLDYLVKEIDLGRCYGVDLSRRMLSIASARLNERAKLQLADVRQ